jgi:hypothetical protein
MAEVIREALPVEIDYVCDDCGQGRMRRSNGVTLFSDPPQYEHACDHCGAVKRFRVSYPGHGWVDAPGAEWVPTNRSKP